MITHRVESLQGALRRRNKRQIRFQTGGSDNLCRTFGVLATARRQAAFKIIVRIHPVNCLGMAHKNEIGHCHLP